MYDTIIIGAGMSGLAAGIRLAYFDQRVCILERHVTIGGLNSFYRLRGRDFDVGLHALTNFTPKGAKKGPLARLIRQLRFQWEDFALAAQIGSAIAFPGVELRFGNGVGLLESEIARAFPGQRDNFQRLLRRLVDYDDLAPEHWQLSARGILAETIDDPLLVEMLLCPLMWYGNAREHDMDFGQFCIMFRSIFLEGLARPLAGVRVILKNLVRKFRGLGGELRLRSGVEHITVDAGRATGVVLENGERLEGRRILSSAGLLETLRLCEDITEVDARRSGRLSFVESVSVLDKQPADLGCDRTIVFFNDSNRFHWQVPDQDLCDLRTGVICSPNNYRYDSAAGQLSEGVIRITALANFARWAALPEAQYRLEKLRWYDRVVQSAVRFVPDYRARVIDTDMFTPTTIRRFTWHDNGAVYGAPEKRNDGTTHLPNLFLCGTDQGFVGIVGAIMSGIAMANQHCLKDEDMPKDFLQGAKDEYDVVVIGSGLGGLTAANVLGRAGYSVLLLEQHYKLGGLATWFKRPGGYTFDISLHGFPVGMIKSCRRYWTSEIADRIVQLKHVRFDNPMFSLTTTYDRQDFTRLLVERFGIAASTVQAFFDAARGMHFYDDQQLTTGELFERFFPGRQDVVRLLMEPIVYANGSTLEDPAITYGIVFSNFMSKGVFVFEGGTDRLVQLMHQELLRNGVDVRIRCPGQRILVHQGRVAGVQVNGRAIKARAVVSNANLKSTILQLVGGQHFDPKFLEESASVRLNNASTQVYMALKPGEFIEESTGDLLFSSTSPEFRTDLLLSRDVTSRTFSFYYPRSRPQSPPRCLVVSSTNARYEDWANLLPDDYEARKRDLIETTLDALDKYVPNCRERMARVEAATPITFQHYTLHVAGASFGTKFEGLGVSRGLPEQVRGLYHAGSVGIIMSGWLGAINYGVIVANDVDAFLVRSAVQAAPVKP